jgi:flagellar hook-length control protein FliK
VAALVNDAVSVPVGERGWDRALGERVLWLVGQQVQAAEVKLNPPHLGPVEVRVSLTGQDASVSFTVAHGATRDAIEQAIPRLRELFAQHQLQIVNVDVGQRDASSQASHGDRSGQGGTPSAGSAERSAAIAAEPVVVARQVSVSGLVDEYA